MKNFKSEVKLFFFVAFIAVVISVGGILLLKTMGFADFPMMEMSPFAPCDLNTDGQCDGADLVPFQKALGTKRGDLNYNLFADTNADGIVTVDDAVVFPFPVTLAVPPRGVVDTSNWQTYRNDEFGFEVDYPSDWEVKENLAEWATKGVRSIGFKDKDSETGFGVQQYSNPKNLSFDEWWDKLTLVCNEEGKMCRGTVQRADSANIIKVGGFPAILSGMIYVANGNRNLFVLSGWEGNVLGFGSGTLVDQILGTFRFVE